MGEERDHTERGDFTKKADTSGHRVAVGSTEAMSRKGSEGTRFAVFKPKGTRRGSVIAGMGGVTRGGR